nr:DUF5666 domain-containing protein [uncultured Roseococcus sp.]
MNSTKFLAALLLLSVGACSHRTTPPPTHSPFLAGTAETCRIGPNGGPPARTAMPQLASDDRGIGGTGQRASAEEGDRGIGGTGIVGVVTGFASICVNGLHIGYDQTVPVVFGDVVTPPDALRVGQVVVISASEQEGALKARRVAVRYEVSGPVEAVGPGSLRVAGQRVTLVGAVPGGTGWQVGDSVMVSGLRGPDGSVIASRIDPRPAGAPRTVTVYGVLQRRDGVTSVGNLPIRAEPGLLLPDPGPVIATGLVQDGVLLPIAVVPDLLLRDPTDWFGPAYSRFFFEGYLSLGDGTVMLGSALHARAPAGIAPFGARRGVVELRPEPGGEVAASGLRDTAGAPITGAPLGALRQAPMPGALPGNPAGQRSELAPMPDRRLDRRQRAGSEAAGRDGNAALRNRPTDRNRRDRPDNDDRPMPPGAFPGNIQGGGFQGGPPPGGGFPGRPR